MEPEGLLPFTQEPNTCSFPKSEESNPHPRILFFKNNSNRVRKRLQKSSIFPVTSPWKCGFHWWNFVKFYFGLLL